MDAENMQTFAFNKADDMKELLSDFDYYVSSGKQMQGLVMDYER